MKWLCLSLCLFIVTHGFGQTLCTCGKSLNSIASIQWDDPDPEIHISVPERRVLFIRVAEDQKIDLPTLIESSKVNQQPVKETKETRSERLASRPQKSKGRSAFKWKVSKRKKKMRKYRGRCPVF